MKKIAFSAKVKNRQHKKQYKTTPSKLTFSNGQTFKESLHNSGEAVAVGSGWAARRLFAANGKAIGKKNNAVDRPSPADHRPQGVM
jgi:hypothetical protein